jgi:hypothetical protein
MLGKAALVSESGTVENVIIIDGNYEPNQEYTVVPIDGTSVSIGDLWDGNAFINKSMEQALLDSLIPTAEEVAEAEFELKTLTLLMEVGLL